MTFCRHPVLLSGGKAVANDAKADMPAAMSAVEGRADVLGYP